jgi:hypothetical protein
MIKTADLIGPLWLRRRNGSPDRNKINRFGFICIAFEEFLGKNKSGIMS